MILRRSRIFVLCLTLVAAWQSRLLAVPVEDDAANRDYQAQLPHIAPTEPADVHATFRIEPGFKVELVAAEPLIADPVAAAFDELGRLYVVEMCDYSEDAQLNLGRIRRLEDRDHDGRFDHASTFVEGLSWPTAIACWKGGVIVAQSPEIVFHEDSDNDGVADTHETLFRGFGRENVQGMLNSLRWGLDNRLYGSSSTNGGEITSLAAPQDPTLQLRRRDFRIDPRTWHMEAVTGGGQHGMSFDRWGQRYVCANSDHLQWVCYEQEEILSHPRLGQHRSVKSIAADGPAAEVFRVSQIEPWRLVRTRLRLKGLVPGTVEGGGRAAGYFTSATGVTIYQGDAYPLPFRTGTYAFVGDVGSNLVHCKEIREEGLEPRGYRVHEGREFLASTDVWFRPVQMELGPDGNLYVLDMYREVIEHPASLPPVIKQHLDLTSGRDRGRIYRIVAEDYQYEDRLLPGNASPQQLCRMVAHPNGWHRETAARLILQNPQEIYATELKSLIRDTDNASGRIRAFYLLDDLHQLSDEDITISLLDPEPWVRSHAIRLIKRMSNEQVQFETFTEMAQDQDPHVLRQLILSLDLLPMERRLLLWTQLIRIAPAIERLQQALLDGVDIAPRQGLQQLLAQPDEQSPLQVLIIDSLIQQLGASRMPADIVFILEQLDDDRIAESRDRRLDLLLACGLKSDPLADLLDTGGLRDARDFLEALTNQARRQVRGTDEQLSRREQALEFLARCDNKQDENFWALMLTHDQPGALRNAALRVVAEACPEAAPRLLLQAIPHLLPSERQQAWDTVLSRKENIPLVFEQLQTETLQPQDISVAHRDRLLRDPDPLLRQTAEKWFATSSDRKQVQERFAQVLQMEGDITRGQQVFRRACVTCHRIADQGANVGPELTVARRKGAEFLLTNVLDPNREVDPRYEGYVIEMKDGRVFNGLVTEQSATSVTLRRPEGIEEKLLLTDIESLRSSGRSLMPEGLESDITVPQMADLLAYLTHEVSLEN